MNEADASVQVNLTSAAHAAQLCPKGVKPHYSSLTDRFTSCERTSSIYSYCIFCKHDPGANVDGPV